MENRDGPKREATLRDQLARPSQAANSSIQCADGVSGIAHAERVASFLQEVRFDGALRGAQGRHHSQAVFDGHGGVVHVRAR